MSMIDAQQSAALRPARRLRDVAAYQPPALYDAVDLWLDANEGRAPSAEVLGALACLPADDVRRYARPGSLEADISARFGIEVNQVVVTNGGDESIDRLCRAVLDRDRGLVLHTPTFEMIPRSARLADAQIREVRWWDETFPAGAMVHAIDASTGMVAVVSPNNPTGSVIATPDLITIADRAAAVGAVVMVDFAYIEFADADPTLELLQRENVAVVRTFSKAWGMAGLRVGYTLTSSRIAGWMRAVGGPYPVSAPSLAVAAAALRADDRERTVRIERVRTEREQLVAWLEQRGMNPFASEANFVTARSDQAHVLAKALRADGIGIRVFNGDALRSCMRITLPGEPGAFARLMTALRDAANVLVDRPMEQSS